MKWHTITLQYPNPLTEEQEDILIINWRATRTLTEEALIKQMNKLRRVRLIAGKTVDIAIDMIEERLDHIDSFFALDKKSDTEYVLMISAILLPDDGKAKFSVFGRNLTLVDTIKIIAHRFWNDISKDMAIDKKTVKYDVGVLEVNQNS